MKLKWDRTTISASEVNRYTYCPYQWYFERYYGRSKLFQMSKTKKQSHKLLQLLKQSQKTKKRQQQKRENPILQEGVLIMPKNIKILEESKRCFFFCVTITVIILIVCIFILLIK